MRRARTNDVIPEGRRNSRGALTAIEITLVVDTYGHIGDVQMRSAADAMDTALGEVRATAS
jgi:hypothetical protein